MRNIIIISCMLAISQIICAQDSRFFADDLPIKSFSEGIPSIAGKTNAAI